MGIMQPPESQGLIRNNFRAFPGHPRLLWDPKAHESVDESCRFYLLSSRDGRGRDLQGVVDEAFRKIGIHGATSHIIYGPMDLLIRAWMSESKRLAFLRIIQQPEFDLRLEQFAEFEAESVRYINCGIVQAVEGVDREQVIKLVKALQEAQGVPSREVNTLVDQALEARILHRYTSPEGIKIYMFVYGPQGRVIRSSDEIQIEKTLAETDSLNVTIYRGSGFCAGIVKVITPTYQGSLDIVERIQDTLLKLGLYCWSLVPPNRDRTKEGETLHLPDDEAEAVAKRLMIDLEDQGIQDSLKHKFEMNIETALQNREIRKNVQELIGIAEETLQGNRAKQRFNSILCGILAKDVRTINKRLSFLISFESNLRSLLASLSRLDSRLIDARTWPEINADLLGERSTSRAVLMSPENRGPSPQEYLKQLDLPALILYLKEFEKLSIIKFKGALAPLGEFINYSDKIHRLRNKYAHGIILDLALEEDFQNEMWDILRDLISAIGIQIAVESLITD